MKRIDRILTCCDNLLERIKNGIRNKYGSIIAFLIFFLWNSWVWNRYYEKELMDYKRVIKYLKCEQKVKLLQEKYNIIKDFLAETGMADEEFLREN